MFVTHPAVSHRRVVQWTCQILGQVRYGVQLSQFQGKYDSLGVRGRWCLAKRSKLPMKDDLLPVIALSNKIYGIEAVQE